MNKGKFIITSNFYVKFITILMYQFRRLKKKKFQMSPINFQSRSFVMKDTIDFLILENRNVRNITY